MRNLEDNKYAAYAFYVVPFLLVSPPKPYMYFTSPPDPQDGPYISWSLELSPDLYLVRLTSRAVFVMSFVQHPVNFCALGPNVVLSILFSNSLCLCSSLNEN